MEEYLLDLFMVFYMELTECEEEKKKPSLEKTSWDTVVFYEEPYKRKEGEILDQKRGAGYRGFHC